MSPQGPPPPPPPPPPRGQGQGPGGRPARSDQGWPRWSLWVLLGVLVSVAAPPRLRRRRAAATTITYSEFLDAGRAGQGRVDRVRQHQRQASPASSRTARSSRTTGLTAVPRRRPGHCSASTTSTSSSKTPDAELPRARGSRSLLPIALIIGFFVWMQRRAQGQMGSIMSIGRSQGEDLLHRAAGHDLRRRRRLRGREAGDPRGRRLPEVPREVRRDRRPHPQGRAARRPPGHRQDPHRPGRGRRGRRAVPVGVRLGLHGDVRRRRRQPGPRPVPDGPQDGPGDHLRRRDRLHRPQARRRPRRRPRRAGADAQPDALGDGRLRGHRGHRDDGGHQPARHPRPRPAAPRPLRPPGRRPAARARRAPRHPQGPHQGQAHRPPTSTSTSWPGARPA